MKIFRYVMVSGLLLLSTQSRANFSGGDDFDDNAVDSGRWSLPEQGLGTMNEVNGRLEYWGNSDESGASWIANAGSYTQDWAIVVDAHNSDDNRIAGMYVPFGPSNSYVNIEHHRNADISNQHLVFSAFDMDGDDVGEAIEFSVPITNDIVTLGLAFDSDTKTIYGAFDTGSGFVVVSSYNISGIGMSDGDSFSFGLYAGTESPINVTPGTLYFDNFATVPNTGFLGSDGDGDGMTFLAELISGTDPNDSNSVWQCSLVLTNGGFRLSWPSISGRTYTVMRTTNLTNEFTAISPPLPGLPPGNWFESTNMPSNAFYRVKVEE